jgi:hypothetical protein
VCVCVRARACEVVDGIKVTDDRVQCRGDGNSFTKSAELLTG